MLFGKTEWVLHDLVFCVCGLPAIPLFTHIGYGPMKPSSSVKAMGFCIAALILGSSPAIAAAQVWTDISPVTSAGDDVRQFEFDPHDPMHLVVLTGLTLHESFDGGQNWSVVPLSALPGSFECFDLAADGSLHVGISRLLSGSAPSGEPYIYRRGAAGWTPFGPLIVPPPPANFPRWGVGKIAFGRGNPELAAFVLFEKGNHTYGMRTQHYLSDDGGATWSAPTIDIGVPLSLDVVESAGAAQLFYTSGVFPSTGTETTLSWSTSWGPPVGPAVHAYGEFSLHASRRDPAELLRSAYDHYTPLGSSERMERSIDGGQTWTPFGAPGNYGSLVQSSIVPRFILRQPAVTTSSMGPQMSRDGGATWVMMARSTTMHGAYFEFVLSPDESLLYAYPVQAYATVNTHKLLVASFLELVGASECTAQLNQTGYAASITASGSSSLAADNLHLTLTDVPPSATVLLLASRAAGFVANPGGSFGNLCLSGPLGRFPASLSTTSGAWFHEVDTDQIPTPMGTVAVMQGETWRFQAWFRDHPAGVPGSNFTDAIAVTFVP